MIDKNTVVCALERAVADKISKGELIDLIDNIPNELGYKLISEALHQAYHFLSDLDLREVDREYEYSSIEGIKNYISLIKQREFPC